MMKRGITIRREVLLIEIERRCSSPECNSRNFISLTKQETLEYTGYECSECEAWNRDQLKRSEVPDGWDDMNLETTH